MSGSLPLEVLWAGQTGRKPWAYPEYVGGITYPICPGSTYGSRRKSLLLGKRTVDCSAHPVGTVTLTRISGSKMDEWKDGCPPSTLLPQ